MEPITHIHHISAIVGDAQETYEFIYKCIKFNFD